ncbi:hypothetical protein [Methylocaldum szegediense]|uniref:Uncharacterized protein n=1 Tax=Methylocaldum szegediense TaxID=73780 RepID=A0ABN8X315_9GAMM|nr:hypothetical protein [Methylocaldum szegediense]CAI8794178.1 conserved membrane protein of unknown function [Methylocaldum szegediense]
MNNFIQFSKVDRTMWLGILGFSAIFIVLMSVFTTTSPFYYAKRVIISILIMFIPGYSITKLFFDHLEFTEYKALDKFLVSFFFSIATVQTLYFIATYIRTYAMNVDEDVISSNSIAITIATLVTAAAFGVKFYLNKKKAATS